MLTIIIPYSSNKTALATLLILIQPQLAKDDDIYILDASKDRSGVEVATTYGSSRSYILIEPVPTLSLSPGFQFMKENNQQGALIIPPNTIVATTFIANLKKAMKYPFLTFKEVHAMGGFDPNFKWFTPPPHVIVKDPDTTSQVFYISSENVCNNTPLYNSKEAGYIESEHIIILS